MNKDVIYIDADDDVTAIIGKIKKSKEKIVAVVPPKRTGALQSAVNLRLLQRMAKTDKKNLVLVTNNQSLIALAASASIPVAKNLQSKPEVAEIPALAVDDGDDIIDGADLPVGDHAKTAKNTTGQGKSTPPDEDDLDQVDINSIDDKPVVKSSSKKVAVLKSKVKIPDFDSFRKKLFIAIAGGVALIGLLVWMFVFAPAATVIVTTRTNPAPLSSTVALSETESTDYSKGILKAVVSKIEKEETVEFTATEQKDIGDKATGILRISKLTEDPYGVPAGTRFTTTGGLVFVTQEAATIPAYSVCFPSLCAGATDVDVVAEKPGTEYNGISGSASGPGGVSGSFQGSTSGGTSKIAKVVSAEDIERAKGVLLGESTDEVKEELYQTFKNGEKVIDSSFNAKMDKATTKPAVGQAVGEDGKAVLTVPTTYTMYAVTTLDIEKYLTDGLTDLMSDQDTQQIYETGAEAVEIGNFERDGDKVSASIAATGQIGPKIDADVIKNEARGKRFGDVQSKLMAINGIDDVEVKFSYFWVRTVPNNLNKIDVEFRLQDEN